MAGKPRGGARPLLCLFSVFFGALIALMWMAEVGKTGNSVRLGGGHPRIFVSISAYRDKECASTILDMYHKAFYPQRVFTGAVAYVKHGNTTKGETCKDASLFQYQHYIQHFISNHTDARGPTLARWECAQAYNGEDYYMQIDSHMTFVPGWDVRMIKMLDKAPSKKPVLTAYPAASGVKDNGLTPVICKSTFNWQNIPTWEAALVRSTPNDSLRETPLVAGGYFFTYGKAIQEVPFDDRLPYLFTGEESAYSARLWTHGWDFYAPNVNLIYHHYLRKGSPKFWEDLGGPKYDQGLQESVRTVLKLLNDTLPGYKFNMGKVRSIKQYWEWAQVDWVTKNSTSSKKFC